MPTQQPDRICLPRIFDLPATVIAMPTNAKLDQLSILFPTKRAGSHAIRSVSLAFAVLLVSPVAEAQSLSQQLLQSYFSTAGVCTTSRVQSITDSGGIVTIKLDIESATKLALQKMEQSARNDWFSLHCPPEIHGVWRQQSPPNDITISSALSSSVTHELSCLQYRQDENTHRLSIREKIRLRISNLLNQ